MIDFHVPVPLLRTWKSIDDGIPGFEPGKRDSKSLGLPLAYTPKIRLLGRLRDLRTLLGIPFRSQ